MSPKLDSLLPYFDENPLLFLLFRNRKRRKMVGALLADWLISPLGPATFSPTCWGTGMAAWGGGQKRAPAFRNDR